MTYLTYVDIANELQIRTESALQAEGFDTESGCSNVSCSRYVTVRFEDDEGVIDTFKIRFSDHDDRYGSDLTIRFEHHIDEVEDEYGDTELEIADWRMDDMVEQAVTAAKEAYERIKSDQYPNAA